MMVVPIIPKIVNDTTSIRGESHTVEEGRAMKSIVRSARADDTRDFRQTPEVAVLALCESGLLDPKAHYLDPCCGNRPIGHVLQKYGYAIEEHDLFIDGVDYLTDDAYRDSVIMNPPYNQKYAFLDHALETAQAVYAILPLQWANYNVTIQKYFSRPDYMGKLLLTPKFQMTDAYQTTLTCRGGNTAYAWFIWKAAHQSHGVSREWYGNLDTITALMTDGQMVLIDSVGR
jgi:hypothetical protein